MSEPLRFIPEGGITADTAHDEFAKLLATHLAHAGVSDTGALPEAITLMGCFQAALDAGSIRGATDYLRREHRWFNRWADKYHPKNKKLRRYPTE